MRLPVSVTCCRSADAHGDTVTLYIDSLALAGPGSESSEHRYLNADCRHTVREATRTEGVETRMQNALRIDDERRGVCPSRHRQGTDAARRSECKTRSRIQIGYKSIQSNIKVCD
jgi:hypothetical protein